MKTKLVFYGALSLCLNVQSMAQTLKDGHVIGTVPLGSSEYSIIHEDNSDHYYKTSPHTTGELTTNQFVELSFDQAETDQAEVITATLTSTLFCEIMQEESPAPTVLPTFTEPTVENGMLFFQSTQHIAEVYEALTNFTDQGDIDEQLDIFETAYPGYVSFRMYLITKYNWLQGALTQQELTNLYYEDFIADEIKKTFLNDERMVGVGDSVYYMHDLGFIYAVHKDSNDVIQALADTDREDDVLEPSGSAYKYLLEIDIRKGHIEGEDRGTVIVDPDDDGDSCWYKTRLVYRNDVDCEPFVKGFSIYLVEYYLPEGGTLDSSTHNGILSHEIDWGDGTSQTISGYSGEFVNHTYPDYDEYFPQTVITFNDRYGNTQTIEDGNESDDGFDIEIFVNASCGKNDALDYIFDNEGGYQIVGRVWINDNFLGNHIGSFTHLYEIQGDGSLELVKGSLFTDVAGLFYTSWCEYQDSKYGDKQRNRRRKIQKVKNKFFQYYRYDAENGVKSKHWFVKDGNFSQILGHVSPCD